MLTSATLLRASRERVVALVVCALSSAIRTVVLKLDW
jgi:hypothetical protein